jgi:hypothetical protein
MGIEVEDHKDQRHIFFASAQRTTNRSSESRRRSRESALSNRQGTISILGDGICSRSRKGSSPVAWTMFIDLRLSPKEARKQPKETPTNVNPNKHNGMNATRREKATRSARLRQITARDPLGDPRERAACLGRKAAGHAGRGSTGKFQHRRHFGRFFAGDWAEECLRFVKVWPFGGFRFR